MSEGKILNFCPIKSKEQLEEKKEVVSDSALGFMFLSLEVFLFGKVFELL